MNKSNRNLIFIPIAFLFLALAPMPYGYYSLLRVVVAVATGLCAFGEFAKREHVSGWVVALAGIALLFNPVVPVRFPRETWAFLDVGAAIVLLCYRGVCSKTKG